MVSREARDHRTHAAKDRAVGTAPWGWVLGLTLGLLLTVTVTGCAQAADDGRHAATKTKAPAATYRHQIINTYPHDPMAFTQGLIFAAGELYEGTGQYGASSLRRVRLASGEVLQQVNLNDAYFGEGITLFDDKLIQLTWKSGKGFVYDRKTLRQQRVFPYAGEGWGITHDGTHLIISNGTNRLLFLDPTTFEQAKPPLEVYDGSKPVHWLNELELVRGVIYANVWMTDRVAMISPQDGAVIGWLYLSGLRPPSTLPNSVAVANGIAFDASTGRLLVTGKLWPSLFEIAVVKETR